MKILVTGATGFIGNHVIQHLLDNYSSHKIIATSSSESKAQKFSWYKQVTFKELDLNKPFNYVSGFDFFDRPDKLIHLAWQGLPNYKDLFHFETNLFVQYTFLKNLIEGGLKDVAVTGTCFEYGMREGNLNEGMESHPTNPYGLAKDSLRKFLEELAKKENFDLKWVRLFYMYGNGQASGSLIAQLDNALKKGEEFFNMSGGEQLRDYLPVEKIAEYLVKISLQNEIKGIINCASGEPISVKDFVLEHLKRRNRKIKLNLGYYPYPDYEAMRFWGDTTKLEKILRRNDSVGLSNNR